MSEFEVVTDDAPLAVPGLSSLAELAEARRAAYAANKSETFDVPGFGGQIKARYRLLTYRERRQMVSRIGSENLPTEVDRDLSLFADTLINACESVVRVNPDGSTTDLGRWDPRLAEQFGYSHCENARQAVFAILEIEDAVVDHHYDYHMWADSVSSGLDKDEADFFG